MPRILGYTPQWLSRPSMGFKIFSNASSTHRNGATTEPSIARLIARRGTQIFVVVDNELRWTDLVYLKDYEAANSSRKTTPPSESSYPDSLFRVCDMSHHC
jgi:nucleoporin NUP82